MVIGSKGFIGSHVMAFYAKRQEVQVWSCDVVTDYAADNYIQIDATNADFDVVFMERQFDACINCSGAASVPDSFQHTSRDFVLNVLNVQRMLESIRKHQKHCRFLNLSSAAVYGNPSLLPVPESAPLNPLSPYGWHKLYAEQICREYASYFEVPTCSARIFSAYGPRLQKQLFWDWHQKIRNEKHLAILGTGQESRDFIFVEDVVAAINCILEKGDFAGEAINVANGHEVTIRDAASYFQKCYMEKFTCSFTQEFRKGDPLNWMADISILKSMGYQPEFSLEQGLQRYMKWIQTLE